MRFLYDVAYLYLINIFMYRALLLSIIVTSTLFSTSPTLHNRLQNLDGGEFIVTESNKILTLLTYHPLPKKDRIMVEEISTPKNAISFPIVWQSWIDKYAPGHHSWTLYEIDTRSGELISCFSPSKNEWLPIAGESRILPQLLGLPLKEVSDCKRKRIGPPPPAHIETEDYRPLWAPLLIYNGQIVKDADFDVYETSWPKDNTPLSLAHITLYFHRQNSSFPFPYWVQIDNGLARAKIRILDSGTGLQSLFPNMPRRNLVGSDLEK